MTNPRDLLLSSYDYELHDDYIAQSPSEPRHAARLFVVPPLLSDSSLSRHLKVWDLQKELRSGDLLVVNDTRVLKARLRIRLSSGRTAELFLLEPRGKGVWLCLANPAKQLHPGDQIFLEAFGKEPFPLKVLSIDSSTGGRLVEFSPDYSNAEMIEDLLDFYGEVPLPPYIEKLEENDAERYQTRFAVKPGAVAAPTAGLHLSDELLRALESRGVKRSTITLHVGLGTFRPLKNEDLSNLTLHSEWVEVTEKLIQDVNECRANGGRVIAIGTTTVRALESSASLGKGALKPFSGPIDLVIKPGFKFYVVDGLLTNFHLPKSSLLLLVSALIGRERLLALYADAIKRQYRFYSYGDAMLILPESVLVGSRPKKITGFE